MSHAISLLRRLLLTSINLSFHHYYNSGCEEMELRELALASQDMVAGCCPPPACVSHHLDRPKVHSALHKGGSIAWTSMK